MQVENRVVLEREEYDIYDADALDAELRNAEAATIVDFKNVRYIDSTALGRMIRTLKRLRTSDSDATLVFENVAPSIAHVLAITGLDKLFIVR